MWSVQLSSTLSGGLQGAAPATPALEHHTGWGDSSPCKVLNLAGLFPLHPPKGKNWWFIIVKYKLSLILLVSMTQIKMVP